MLLYIIVLVGGFFIFLTCVHIFVAGVAGSEDTIKKAFDTIRAIDRLMNPDDENSELTPYKYILSGL